MISMRRRLHSLPGRLRIQVEGLRGHPDIARAVTDALHQEPGVQETRANPLTGKALILYDPRRLSETRLIGLIETFEHERAHYRAPRSGARPNGFAVAHPALAAGLFVSTASGVAVFGPQSAGVRQGLSVASAALAVAAGYPQAPSFGLDLNGALDLLRTICYGATDDAIGLAGSAVSSYGALMERRAAAAAGREIGRLVEEDVPGDARAELERLLQQDPNAEGNRLPADVPTYVESASVPALALSSVGPLFGWPWWMPLAVLLAANPRPVHAAAITTSGAALQAAADRRLLVRRLGAIAALGDTTVVLLDDRVWDAMRAGARDALSVRLQELGIRSGRLPGEAAAAAAAVRGQQQHGRAVAVVAASPSSLEAMKAADVSVAVLGKGWTPPPFAADVIVPDTHVRHLPDLLALARGAERINRQNRQLTALLSATGAVLAMLGRLSLTGASALYNVAVLLATLNARRLAASRRATRPEPQAARAAAGGTGLPRPFPAPSPP